MATLPTAPTRFLGCDVGKRSITVFDSQADTIRTLANEAGELAAFATSLDPSCLVVCEATGGYETALLDAVTQAGHAAHRADARKVKAFIRSFGTLGKTDAIDAQALARYGQERHLKLTPWRTIDPERARLQALVLARDDLIAQRQAYGNRLAAPGADPVAPSLRRVLACLEREIKTIEADIKTLIHNHPSLDAAARTLRAIPGLGEHSVAALLALMPELGTLGRRQAAALAGLAPHPRQSGTANAYRRTRGGRPQIKRLLFMAALAAARHNPTLRPFYQRLIANGKKPLLAITAVMRKIIVIANAKLRYIPSTI